MKHKDHYNDAYLVELANNIHTNMPSFNKQGFLQELLGKLDDKELFARFDCIVDALQENMSGNYTTDIQVFSQMLGPELAESKGMFNEGWWLWPIGRYVERYGNIEWKLSLAFLKELTKRFTGEYAIRPLLKEHPKEVLAELLLWTRDDNVHVRRLASEGVRIRLPWSQKLLIALDEFETYAELLTNLKDDPEKFVQISVGNNLNELYKDAPDKAAQLIAQWKQSGSSKAQEWIIKHGKRKQK